MEDLILTAAGSLASLRVYHEHPGNSSKCQDARWFLLGNLKVFSLPNKEESAPAFLEINSMTRIHSGINQQISPGMSAVFAVLCALLVPRVPVAADLSAVNCSQVKDAFTDLGYSPANVPSEETAGIN